MFVEELNRVPLHFVASNVCASSCLCLGVFFWRCVCWSVEYSWLLLLVVLLRMLCVCRVLLCPCGFAFVEELERSFVV